MTIPAVTPMNILEFARVTYSLLTELAAATKATEKNTGCKKAGIILATRSTSKVGA